jgi:outer membrane receptor for ferrienterochelin and colicin
LAEASTLTGCTTNAKIPAYYYIDLETTWNVNKVLQLRAGANNVVEKDPPVLVAGGAADADSTYDIFGPPGKF